jgi:hypothetical protein
VTLSVCHHPARYIGADILCALILKNASLYFQFGVTPLLCATGCALDDNDRNDYSGGGGDGNNNNDDNNATISEFTVSFV